MSGIPKAKLDYAGWATDIFDSESSPFDELLDSQGWVGFGVFFFLCQRAYSTDGYFYRWSYKNAASTARKMGGGVKTETVKQVVSLCLQIGLFDSRLFDREGILTNKMIQERYMIAIEKRSKNGRTVNGKYWLLNEDETKAYVVIPSNVNSLPEDVNPIPEDTTKESKVKESKVKCVEGDALTYGTHNNIHLTAVQYDELCRDYGKAVIDDYIERCGDYVANSGKKPYSNHYQTLLNWLMKDGVQKQEQHSYDVDKILAHAKANVSKL